MRRFLIGLLATVGFLALVVAAGAGAVGWWAARHLLAPPELPERIVLRLDLRESIGELSRTPRLPGVRPASVSTVTGIVLALERARSDPRVHGLVALLGDSAQGLAVARELRQAVARFRQSNRFTIAWADSFGELASGNEGYYLATAFDEIALQPVGLVGLTGLLIETPFLRPLLDWIGAEPMVARREEYKTALESFTESRPTAANREMLESLADSLFATVSAEVSTARRLDPSEAAAILGGGPYAAEEAIRLHLVDHVAYRDEIETMAEARAGRGARLVDLDRYASEASEAGDGPVVALIRASGPIARGSDELGSTIGADDLAEMLAAGTEDAEVRAILLRLDSPGGSAVASETIARHVRRAVAAGKPVVVSMGNRGASGGYWIAMEASRVVAQPTTLTGSIGVLAGKPVLAAAWERLGVHWEHVARGSNAALWSPNTPFSATGRARIEHLLDGIYSAFKDGVARGRGLDREQVDQIARGRVWTGRQALELGLVDRLGGVHEALEEVRALAGLQPDAPLRIRVLPEEEPLWRFARRMLRGSVLAADAVISAVHGVMAGGNTPFALPTTR